MTPPHDILSLLEKDHREIEELLSGILTDCWLEKEISPARIAQVIVLMDGHTLTEETLIYPQAEQIDAYGIYDEISERCYLAHEQFRVRLNLMRDMTDPDLLACQCREILEAFIEHHQKEENRIFPVLREAWGEDTLCELGGRMLAMRERATY